MSEQALGEIELRKPDRPEYSQPIILRSEENTPDWGADSKYFVTGVSGKGEAEGKREFKMVRKVLSRGLMSGWMLSEKNTPGDDYYMKWKLLKDSGLPTVPSMRVISENEVVMTDLTADGSELYGKTQYMDMELSQYKLQDKFLAIDMSAVNSEMIRLAKIASDNYISLPNDDPFALLVHPDGAWNVLILDLSKMGLRKRYPFDNELSLHERNGNSVEKVENWLSTIKLMITDARQSAKR